MTEYKDLGLFQRYAFERKDGKPLDEGEEIFQLRFDKDDSWGAACRQTLRDFCARIDAAGYKPLAAELNARIDAVEARIKAARAAAPAPQTLPPEL